MKEYSFDITIGKSSYGNPVLIARFEDEYASIKVHGTPEVSYHLFDMYKKSGNNISWFTNRFDTAIKLIKDHYSTPYQTPAVMDFINRIREIQCWVSDIILDQVKREFSEKPKFDNRTAKVLVEVDCTCNSTLTGSLKACWRIEEDTYGKIYIVQFYPMAASSRWKLGVAGNINDKHWMYEFGDYDEFYNAYIEFTALNPVQRFIKLSQYFPKLIEYTPYAILNN